VSSRERHNDENHELDAETVTATRRRQQPVRRFQVVLHNDDYTSMEFVVEMLMRHFHKLPAEAVHVMLQVHHKGAGVAGVYSRDVAETKVAEVTEEARAAGMPLLLTVEPLGADGPPAGDGAGDDDDEAGASRPGAGRPGAGQSNAGGRPGGRR
jgi:ATP-dependent Clp protease adaptor protein ClpS